MTLRSIAVIALTALGTVTVVAQQPQAGDTKAKLRTPAALTEKAPRHVQSQVRHERRRLHHRSPSRLGAPWGGSFYNLVKNGFFDDVRFFRVLENSWPSSDER